MNKYSRKSKDNKDFKKEFSIHIYIVFHSYMIFVISLKDHI